MTRVAPEVPGKAVASLASVDATEAGEGNTSEDEFPKRLPHINDLPRMPREPLHGGAPVFAFLKSLHIGEKVRYVGEEAIEFLFYWFGALRLFADSRVNSSVGDRIDELANAKNASNDPDRRAELQNKIDQLTQVKMATSAVSRSGAKTSLSAKLGRVKRPKRDQAPQHPSLPAAQPQLRIRVRSARDLRRSDWIPGSDFLPPDPYFTCKTIGGKNQQEYDGRDLVQNNTVDPVWDATFDFTDYRIGDMLEFRVWDKDFDRDDLLGVHQLESKHFYPDGFFGELSLGSTNQASNGSLNVRINVLVPQAKGWGGLPSRLRNAPKGWVAPDLEEEQENEVVEGQLIPKFVMLQVLVAAAFWVFGLGKDAMPMSGLESFAYGHTSLMLQKDCQHDYRFQVWRLFSYQFTHVGFAHMFFNSIWLVLMGVPLEGANGFFDMLCMFNLGVLGGACCWILFDVHTETVGMSGGCYSLLGISLADLIMNWKELKFRLLMLLMLLLVPAVDIVQALAASKDNVSHAAHVGGVIAGVLAGLVMGRNIRTEAWERRLSYGALVMGVGLVIFSLWWGMSESVPRDLLEQARWCWKRQVMDESLFGDSAPHCVRCADRACVQRWEEAVGLDRLSTVSTAECHSELGGWSQVEP